MLLSVGLRNALHSAKKQLKKKKAAKTAQDTASTKELASRTKQQERVIEEMRKESVNLQVRRLELTGRGADATMASKHVQSVQMPVPLQHFLPSSPLAKARIINTLSSKLNYILKEIQEFSAKEKFLIFSKQPLNLVHIAEGLDILGIKYLDYRSRVTKEQSLNFQNLMTFETSDVFRVFLMELKHGARGLNIISASRIIFCEPVWKSDVESQAIKRAHRIGQTKPVTVKTLVIKSTFEEFMLQRRRELKASNAEQLPGSMAEESGMQHYLKNPTFVQPGTEPEIILDAPLLRIPNFGRATADERQGSPSDAERETADVAIGNSLLPAKKEKARFAENPNDNSEGKDRKKVRFV